jgi:hypothetical protein
VSLEKTRLGATGGGGVLALNSPLEKSGVTSGACNFVLTHLLQRDCFTLLRDFGKE